MSNFGHAQHVGEAFSAPYHTQGAAVAGAAVPAPVEGPAPVLRAWPPPPPPLPGAASCDSTSSEHQWQQKQLATAESGSN